MTESVRQDKQKSDDPVVDLFPEDENEDRSSESNFGIIPSLLFQIRPQFPIFLLLFVQIYHQHHLRNLRNRLLLVTKYQLVWEHFTIWLFNTLHKVDTK